MNKKNKLSFQKIWENNHDSIIQKIKKDLNSSTLFLEDGTPYLFFNSYNDFCNYLEIPCLTATSKQNQLKELSCYIDFQTQINPNKKNSKQILITNYFEHSLTKFEDLLRFSILTFLTYIVENRDYFNKNSHYSFCETFSEIGEHFNKTEVMDNMNIEDVYMLGNVSLNTLAYKIGLFSYCYNQYYKNQNKLSSKLKIDKNLIEEFYEKTKKTYEYALHNVINSFNDIGLIYFSNQPYGTPVKLQQENIVKKHLEKNINGDNFYESSVKTNLIKSRPRPLSKLEYLFFKEIAWDVLLLVFWRHSPKNKNPFFINAAGKLAKRNQKKDEMFWKWLKKTLCQSTDLELLNNLKFSEDDFPDFSLIFIKYDVESINVYNHNKFLEQKNRFYATGFMKIKSFEQFVLMSGLSEEFYAALNTATINSLHLDNIVETYDIFFNIKKVNVISKVNAAKMNLQLKVLKQTINTDTFQSFFLELKKQNNKLFTEKIKNNTMKRYKRRLDYYFKYNNDIHDLSDENNNTNPNSTFSDFQSEEERQQAIDNSLSFHIEKNKNENKQLSPKDYELQLSDMLFLIDFLITGNEK